MVVDFKQKFQFQSLISICNLCFKKTIIKFKNSLKNQEDTKRVGIGGEQHSVNKVCVCHTMWPLPFTLKSILRQKKKNYGNSNISPCKNYNLQKILKKKKTKIFQDIITLL
jgi:hypothetical protein